MFGIKRGFTAIEAVIIVAILAIIGSIVWYVNQNKSSADSNELASNSIDGEWNKVYHLGGGG